MTSPLFSSQSRKMPFETNSTGSLTSSGPLSPPPFPVPKMGGEEKNLVYMRPYQGRGGKAGKVHGLIHRQKFLLKIGEPRVVHSSGPGIACVINFHLFLSRSFNTTFTSPRLWRSFCAPGEGPETKHKKGGASAPPLKVEGKNQTEMIPTQARMMEMIPAQHTRAITIHSHGPTLCPFFLAAGT